MPTRPSAEPIGDGWYELTGHKWFCTHPVFEVFFTLAQTDAGITCFVAERPHPGLPRSAPEGQARRSLPGLLGGRVRPPARSPARRGGAGHGLRRRAADLDAPRHPPGSHRHDAPRARRGGLARASPQRLRRPARRSAGDGQRARRSRPRVRGRDRRDDAHRRRLRLRGPRRRLPSGGWPWPS